MTALKEAISVAHRLSSRFPHMPDRLLAVEHAAKRVAQTVADKAATLRAEESDDEFLDRVQNMPIGVVASNPRDMRRLVSVVWSADRRDYTAAAAINAAVEGNRKSFDRAIVSVYLQHFPTHHLDFSHLQAAVSSVADRHDWPWRERGIRWKLWDRSVGPVAVAAELLRADDPREALRSMGFEADLAQGRFAQAAISNVCMEVAITTGEAASRGCTALVSLFSNVGASRDLDPVMARALLRPWQSSSPPEDVRRAITSLIVRRIGDPRIETTRWQLIADELAAGFPSEDPVAVIGVLRRWIVQATVRQFFEVIGRTTSNADQWAQREAFWLAYLDAGYITDAWFAFGPRAETDARRLVKDLEEGGGYGRIVNSTDSGHSALIMSMGDLLIAEWSHNGKCRFWGRGARNRPKLNERTYFDQTLRPTTSGPDYDAMSHFSGWQSRFAYTIGQFTGLRHPRWN